jgi:hypothetical protein
MSVEEGRKGGGREGGGGENHEGGKERWARRNERGTCETISRKALTRFWSSLPSMPSSEIERREGKMEGKERKGREEQKERI